MAYGHICLVNVNGNH